MRSIIYCLLTVCILSPFKTYSDDCQVKAASEIFDLSSTKSVFLEPCTDVKGYTVIKDADGNAVAIELVCTIPDTAKSVTISLADLKATYSPDFVTGTIQSYPDSSQISQRLEDLPPSEPEGNPIENWAVKVDLQNSSPMVAENDLATKLAVFDTYNKPEPLDSFAIDNFSSKTKKQMIAARELALKVGNIEESDQGWSIKPLSSEKEQLYPNLGCKTFYEIRMVKSIRLKNFGGPDIFSIWKEEQKTPRQVGFSIMNDNVYAVFFYNKNEPPTLELAAKDLDVGQFELSATGDDPTDDALTYSWTCKDSKDADCSALLSSTSDAKVTFSNGAPKSIYTVTANVTDAGGLKVSKEAKIDTKNNSVSVEENTGFLGGIMGRGGCSLIR